MFTLVLGAALGMTTSAVQVWLESNQRRLAQQNVLSMMTTMTSEVRQAIPDADPFGSGYV